MASVNRIGKRKNEKLREEVDVKESLTRKLVGSRLEWVGLVGRMEGDG